jgi:hypothetical protein
LPEEQQVMSVRENIEFLKEQKKTFQLVLTNAERIINGRERQIQFNQAKVNEQRQRIRALRQTLVVDGRTPSIAAIQERIRLEDRVMQASKVMERFEKLLEEFKDLAARWHSNQAALSGLPQADTSSDDKSKLAKWTTLLRDQLGQYGFRSLPIPQLSISQDTYRPEHDGFDLVTNMVGQQPGSLDLQTSISASDLIRTIWAYLQGLLEVSRTTKTNHPGFVIFDEPRQQSTRDVSFGELLKRASVAHDYKQQIIFFTSEDRTRLRQQLVGLRHRLIRHYRE